MSHAANREAYLLLTTLIQRAGLRRADFLGRLIELGYEASDDALTNWGRTGRAFPRDWGLLRALVAVVSEGEPTTRCRAEEALRFLSLVELPFSELAAVANMFPPAEFHLALEPYLPSYLATRLLSRTRAAGYV
jgi:hypothetical protein